MKRSLILIVIFIFSINAFPQWQRTFGPFGWSVYHLAEGNGYLYSSGGILFRSSDNGLTWEQKSSGIGQWDVTALFVSGTRVFAGLYDGSGIGYLYFSDDSGESWIQHNATGNTKSITGFTKLGNDLFFSTHQGGIFKSTNNGNTWTQMIASWNPKPAIFTIKTVGSTMFFGEYTGLYKSTDGGATWTHCIVNPDNNCEVYSIAAKGNAIYLIYGSCWGVTSSVWKSTDLGASFQPVAGSLSNAYHVSSDGINVYLGTENGLYRSVDDGASWVRLVLEGETVHTAIVAGNGNIMAGTRDHGIFTSTNNGTSWINSGVLASMSSRAVLSFDNTLIAGNDGQNGVMISRNNGNSFTEFNCLDYSYVNCLVKRGGDIFAGTTPYVPQKGGIFKSSDTGFSWTRIGLPNISVTAIAFSGTHLFAGTIYEGVYRTSDDGITWAQVQNGLPSTWIRSLAYFNNTIYAGTQVGLYASTNNGSSWVLNGFQNVPVTSLAVYNGKLFAGTESGVHLLSGINNWSLTSLYGAVNCLKTVTDKLVAGGNNFLSFTEDDGSNWVSAWKNLGTGPVLDFSFNNDYVFAGRSVEGIWRGGINDILTSVDEKSNPVNYFILYQNHPNPFSKGTEIRYRIAENNSSLSISGGRGIKVSLKVYDLLGREVAALVDESQRQGEYTVSFNAGGLPNGVYIYRLIAGNFAGTGKMVLAR
ncbi:MAG: T9SS type A sorting domain-containing protein [Ignavibacteriaceae bacterium]|nr:T9SS type A sorting domain-containing protein [Ignavibacteriaceae bacterium]